MNIDFNKVGDSGNSSKVGDLVDKKDANSNEADDSTEREELLCYLVAKGNIFI